MKQFGLFLLFSFLFIQVHAQAYFGVKGTGNLALDIFQPASNQMYYQHYSGGIVIKYAGKPKWWFFQMDVNYVTKEQVFTYTELPDIGTGNFFEQINSQNVQVNFLSQPEFGRNGAKVGLHAGPYVSYMLNASRNYYGTDSVFAQPAMKSNIDYGITAGLCFIYSLGASELQLDANFSMSYSMLTTSLEVKEFDYRNNQLVQVSVAYLFAPAKIKRNKMNEN